MFDTSSVTSADILFQYLNLRRVMERLLESYGSLFPKQVDRLLNKKVFMATIAGNL